jgi:hypothetical protein
MKPIKVKNYTVTIKDEYLYIKVEGYARSYQLKLEDEGLVLDVVSEKEDTLEPIYHGTNDEELVCEYCGKPDCDFDCDESQAGGFDD